MPSFLDTHYKYRYITKTKLKLGYTEWLTLVHDVRSVLEHRRYASHGVLGCWVHLLQHERIPHPKERGAQNEREAPLCSPASSKRDVRRFFVMQISEDEEKLFSSLRKFRAAAIILRRPRFVNKICPDKDSGETESVRLQRTDGTVCDSSLLYTRCKVRYNQF